MNQHPARHLRAVLLLLGSFTRLACGISTICFGQGVAGEATVHPTLVPERPVTQTHHLLLDARVIDTVENARLALGTVTKHPANPLFGEDKPWEKRFDNLYANVIYDTEDKLYKCWYSPFIVDYSAKGMTPEQRKSRYQDPPNREMGICYAVSKDGIKWEKPELGLVEFEGSKQNNLVWRGPHGAGVIKDLRETDPARRYKAFFQGINVAFSNDGLHWGESIRCPEIKVAGDTHNNAFWAPELGKYVGITRTWDKAKKVGRQVARSESDDFLKWTPAEVVLQGLEKDLQTYSMPVFRQAGIYLGLATIHQQSSDRVWTELAWSPDTKQWHRVCPGTPLIGNSDKELTYDWGCVYAAAYPVILDHEIRIYYGGSDGLHTGWRNGFFCLATLRPDGWAGYEQINADKPAVVTTKVLTDTGAACRITADVMKRGSLKVTMIDEAGKPLTTSKVITETVTDRELQWDQPLPNTPIRLRFELSGAKVYSFQVQP